MGMIHAKPSGETGAKDAGQEQAELRFRLSLGSGRDTDLLLSMRWRGIVSRVSEGVGGGGKSVLAGVVLICTAAQTLNQR